MVCRELGGYRAKCGVLITRRNNNRTQMNADDQDFKYTDEIAMIDDRT